MAATPAPAQERRVRRSSCLLRPIDGDFTPGGPERKGLRRSAHVHHPVPVGCGFRPCPCIPALSPGVTLRHGRNTQEVRRQRQHTAPYAGAGKRLGLDI
ncbi:hypothetical protein B0G57_1091 [Trinickia symbiotica]|nr:hypothetical protein B0G57_1091 [Trinickia symbiotica]